VRRWLGVGNVLRGREVSRAALPPAAGRDATGGVNRRFGELGHYLSLAKVGIRGQETTRKSGFCTSMHTLSSAQGAGAVLKFFCAGFSAICRGIQTALAAFFRYKSNSGFSLLRQESTDRGIRAETEQDAVFAFWEAATLLVD